MDTGDNTDLEKIQARREKHKARGINGNGFGTSLGEEARRWAGPQARDHFPAHSTDYVAAKKAEGHGMRNLNDEAAQWMAPNVPNGGRSATHAEQVGATLYHEGKKVQLGLEHQAKEWAAPKASDGEKGGPNQRGSKGDIPLPGQAAQWPGPSTGSNNSIRGGVQDPEKRKAGGHQVNLQDVTCFFRLPSSPDQPIAGGSMSSTDGPNTNQPSVKRKLNPIFVEALMRWPTGLSGFERQETAWTQWWQLMPPYVLALCSQKPAAQGSLF